LTEASHAGPTRPTTQQSQQKQRGGEQEQERKDIIIISVITSVIITATQGCNTTNLEPPLLSPLPSL
jgi:hypothetical protein